MINKLIQNLIEYAKRNLYLDSRDEFYIRNRLLEALKEEEFQETKGEALPDLKNPDTVILPLVDYALNKELITEAESEYFAFKLLDIVSLRPSEIINHFQKEYKKSPLAAFSWLYDYNVKNDYVRSTKIAKNIGWIAEETKGKLEISINLSKPEIQHADVKAAAKKKAGYPKCVICPENEGYAGHGTYRQNLRGIPLVLGGEDYFWQFSPYAYFHHHGIAISYEHKPMRVDLNTPKKLFDFVDYIPDYFIGSNAGIPRVGGSILAHDHYQGGYHPMPINNAPIGLHLTSEKYHKTEILIPEWYNSLIRLKGKARSEIEALACDIIAAWERYNDYENEIIAFTDEQHNGFSVIARKENDNYILDIILRNNRTSAEYPDGIFHAHPEYHHIKSEGIGLVEANGFFVLPPRLMRQLGYVESVLTGKIENPDFAGDLEDFRKMTEDLVHRYGNKNSVADAQECIRKEVARVCENILRNIAVFKDTEMGRTGFMRFLESIGLKEVR